MGHMVDFLKFDIKTSKTAIENSASEWCTRNADQWETGGNYIAADVRFLDRTFDNYEEAEEWLDKQSGNYYSYAVKYKDYSKVKSSKTLDNAKTKHKKAFDSYYELSNKVHYSNIKSKTIKCKCCGSVLATEYCGRTYKNNCPVCKTDLRPQTVLDKIAKLKADVATAEQKVNEETKKQQAKSKYELKYLVLVEVHC